MIWQDLVLTIGCFLLALSTLPSVFSRDKPPRKMCFGYMCILASFAMAFATLGLVLSAIGASSQVVTWIVLLIQRRQK